MNQIVLALGFGLVTASIVAIGAVGFSVQYAVSHIFNVAFGAVMSAAAYVAYLANVTFGANIWVAMVAGALGGAVLTTLIYSGIYGRFLSRGSGVFSLIMASLAVSVIVLDAIQAVAGTGFFSYAVPRDRSLHVAGIIWTPREVVIMVLALVTMFLFHGLLRFTRVGKAMRAISDEPDLARISGISVGRITLVAWAMSGMMCGLAGVALALDTVAFNNAIGANFLLVVVAAAVVGGIGSPYGAMAGALVVGIMIELAAILSPNMKDVAAFTLLVLILLVRPEGRQAISSFRPGVTNI
jgi:branched-subunit amino acid ABC-type transport system permease component